MVEDNKIFIILNLKNLFVYKNNNKILAYNETIDKWFKKSYNNINSEEEILRKFIRWLPEQDFTFITYDIEKTLRALNCHLYIYDLNIQTPHSWFSFKNLIINNNDEKLHKIKKIIRNYPPIKYNKFYTLNNLNNFIYEYNSSMYDLKKLIELYYILIKRLN